MEYDASIWTMRQYVREGTPETNLFIAPPAIDPLSPKNVAAHRCRIGNVLHRYDIDPTRPIVCQVSRFDPWKDPLGVIDAYRICKAKHPGLQLVLAGSMAHDDPEGWEWYEKVLRRCGEDYDIKVLTNLNGVGNVEINAFQHASESSSRSPRAKASASSSPKGCGRASPASPATSAVSPSRCRTARAATSWIAQTNAPNARSNCSMTPHSATAWESLAAKKCATSSL